MGLPPPLDVDVTAASVVGVPPALVRAYLIAVAEVIQNDWVPLDVGSSKGSALACIRILSRLAAQLCPVDGALLPLLTSAPTLFHAALNEGKSVENVDEDARRVLRKIVSAPHSVDRAFDAIQLERYLRDHPMGGQILRVVSSRVLSGGRSKLTALITQQGATQLPTEFIIRQDLTGSVVEGSVSSEFAVLQWLLNNGIKVPEPLLVKSPKDAAGNPFILVARKPGKTSGDNQHALPSSVRPVLQLAEQLGRLHALDTRGVAGMPGIVERNYSLEQLHANLDKYSSTIDLLGGQRSQLITAAIDWLRRNAARASDGPPSLVHGDIGFHNSLCDGSDLSVILDWELAHIGHAAYDLGYLQNAIVDEELWNRFIDVYIKSGGPPVSAFCVQYFHIFSCIWFYQLVLQTRAALTAGLVKNIEITVACADIAQFSMARLSRSFAKAITRDN